MMPDIHSFVDLFEITPHQLASFLWRDCTFCLPDCDCEYLESLTPSQLRAFAAVLQSEADIKEDGGLADVA